MDHLLSSQPTESVSIQVEFSPVWEVILGISGYTYRQLRHTFDSDEQWTEDESNIPLSLKKQLEIIEKTNLWHGLIMLQDKFSASSIQDFSNQLEDLSLESFYDTLLPYKDRHTELSRKETAKNYKQVGALEKFAIYFEEHEYLAGYIRALSQYSYEEVCILFNNVLNEWYMWISKHEDWDKWMQALSFEQKQYSSIDHTKPIEEIERITGGLKYLPEPSIWNVKLIPQISYRPWTLEKRTIDTKIFFYPLREEYLLKPGNPSKELVRGHKALGDEVRLKLLYQLLKGPMSLQEMSTQFHISKTTLHHQLSLLKAAKFIRVEKGIYTANGLRVHDFSRKLSDYLGEFK